MPSYTCTKCARVFKQKSGYDDHLAKKKDCLETTAIATVVQETVKQEVRRQTRLTELVLPEDTKARDEALQAFFEALHNLLWNKAGLNPEPALENMMFFFAYRMIEAQADKLNLPANCRWSHIASIQDEQDLFSAIKAGVNEFRKNEATKAFFKPHSITRPEIVQEIVQQINRIPFKALQETDTLGNIFEYMLGRGMSTMSDEGQYFTNRQICRKAFDLAYKIKGSLRRDDGTLCTFADWFCGTGGFPSEFIRGVNTHQADVNWENDIHSIFCHDQNTSSVSTTMLNILISTGQTASTNNMCSGNSFTDPITMGTGALHSGLEIDYCFMNPPYGGDKTKGKEYKFAYTKGKGASKTYCVNQEIQSIGVEDDDKVSAGVQLAMATLADGGVGALVLPQGFFFGASKKCVELRKKIAEDYKIWYVVDIASGSFLNTGTKTSMIVFQKGVGPTEKVAFIGLDEKLLVEATLEDLTAKHYSLNYKQYLAQSLVEVEGFEMIKFGDVVTITTGKNKTPDDKKGTLYPYYGTSGVTGYTDHFLEDGEYILTARNGTIGNTFLIKGKSYPSDHIFTIRANEKCVLKYLYYWMMSNKKVMENLANVTTIPGITRASLIEIQLPLPSLERQHQIVEAIDGWASLAQQEEVALKILEKQMMFQVKEMGRGQARVKLGSIATFTFGYGIKSEDFGESGLPIIKTKNFKEGGVSIINSNPRSYKKYDEKYLIKKGDLLMVVDGACGESAIWLENENAWLNQHVAKLSIENQTTSMYIAFVMKGDEFKEYIQSNVVITTIPHMQRDVAKNFEIPLPPLTEQQTLQSDFDEIRHKHTKIATYKAKAQEAIQRLIPSAASISPEPAPEPEVVAPVETKKKLKIVLKKKATE